MRARSARASPTVAWRSCWSTTENDVRAAAPRAATSAPSTSASTPAPPSSRRTRRTSTRPTRRSARPSPTDRKKIMILGGGPNRIGQGIEFDYCCVHAAFALREDGFETIMVNCNPETVSTDYDTSDRLYFEPLTLEDVLEIVDMEKPDGVIVQFGGQTPLKLARAARGAPACRSSAPRRRDRPRRGPRALRGAAREARAARSRRTAPRAPRSRRSRWRSEIGYPVLVRPSLRARRPRDGDRLRRRRPARATCARRSRCRTTVAGADRPVPRGRDRGRRRLPQRRRATW